MPKIINLWQSVVLLFLKLKAHSPDRSGILFCFFCAHYIWNNKLCEKIILSLCKDYKVDANRVIYFENGHLPTLLKNASGTVVINSTVGLSALVHQCPTITLGTAIYNIPGLTNQCNLDFFWNNLEKPNIDLYIKLEKFLMENNQINGNFYTKKGISMSIEGSLKLLHLTYCLPLVDYVNTLLTSPAKL